MTSTAATLTIKILAITLVSIVILSSINLHSFRNGVRYLTRGLNLSSTGTQPPFNMSTGSFAKWRKALHDLPATPDNIPAFFFAHGSPIIAFDPTVAAEMGPMGKHQGPTGPLANFLKDFGPTLLRKYNPKGIVVFSAHWETQDERLVSDYGKENPLLMDYYGFPPELYQLKFKSKGDSSLAQRVVELFKKAGQKARTTGVEEARGEDGRGFKGPGLDHGVFVPFRIMFGEEFLEIPIVAVSFDSSLDPGKNWEVGKAVSQLRKEGILVLAGGLTSHNLRDRSSFSPDTAGPLHKEFDKAVHEALEKETIDERKKELFDLTKHVGFRASHPREDHFVPIYVAGGAGEDGRVVVLLDAYGLATAAFGVSSV